MEIVETFQEKETFELGVRLGKAAKPGQVITLNGDLGVGKTIFSKGVAKGLGIDEAVSSPTFTIIQEYTTGRLMLYHFDAYRIGDESEMDEIGFDDYVYGDGVCLIEWASQIPNILPQERVEVNIIKDVEKSFSYRKITIESIGGHKE